MGIVLMGNGKERQMAKTVSFGVVHLTVAFTVAYLLTGDVLVSSAVALVEPIANTVAYHFFEKYWTRYDLGRRWEAFRGRAALRVLKSAATVGAYIHPRRGVIALRADRAG
jgi:uncharacterized membrane protein